MIVAGIGDTGYNIVLLLHILTAFVAFAPAFVHPFLGEQSKALDATSRSTLIGFTYKNGRRIYAPALVLTGLLGFGVAGMSDDVYKVSDGWLVTAVIIWIAMNGILHAVLLPAERAMSDGDRAAEARVSLAGAAMTLLLVVMLVLMVWKPGA